MIWRPAPGLIRNPGPAIVGLPNPTASAVRSPAGRLIRNPYLTVIRNFGPLAVGIEILRAGVIAVGVLPTIGMFDQAVAILIERVPIRLRRRVADLVLHVVACALHRDHLAAANARVALGRGDGEFAAANRDLGLAAAVHEDAEAGFFVCGLDRDIGSVNLDACFAVLELTEVRKTLADLNLNLIAIQRRDIRA